MRLVTLHTRQFVLISAICAALLGIGLDGVFSSARGTELPAAFSERQPDRKQMVDSQLKGWGRTAISDAAVLQAMLKVPRHLFVPPNHSALAYQDSPVPIGHGQTISQPYIVALMTQALELKPGMKVLEIGTGAGYQAAVL